MHAAVRRGQHHVEAEHRGERGVGPAFVREHVAHDEQAAGNQAVRGAFDQAAASLLGFAVEHAGHQHDVLARAECRAVVVAVPQRHAVARPGGRDEVARNGCDAGQFEHLGLEAGKPLGEEHRVSPRSATDVEHRAPVVEIQDADQRARDAERAFVHRLHETARSNGIVAKVGLRRKRGAAGAQRILELAPRPVELVAVADDIAHEGRAARDQERGGDG